MVTLSTYTNDGSDEGNILQNLSPAWTCCSSHWFTHAWGKLKGSHILHSHLGPFLPQISLASNQLQHKWTTSKTSTDWCGQPVCGCFELANHDCTKTHLTQELCYIIMLSPVLSAPLSLLEPPTWFNFCSCDVAGGATVPHGPEPAAWPGTECYISWAPVPHCSRLASLLNQCLQCCHAKAHAHTHAHMHKDDACRLFLLFSHGGLPKNK